jgi:hypothetical protein
MSALGPVHDASFLRIMRLRRPSRLQFDVNDSSLFDFAALVGLSPALAAPRQPAPASCPPEAERRKLPPPAGRHPPHQAWGARAEASAPCDERAEAVDVEREAELAGARAGMLRRRLLQRLLRKASRSVFALFGAAGGGGRGASGAAQAHAAAEAEAGLPAAAFSRQLVGLGAMGAAQAALLLQELCPSAPASAPAPTVTPAQLRAFLACDPQLGLRARDPHARPQADAGLRREVRRQVRANVQKLAQLQVRTARRCSLRG